MRRARGERPRAARITFTLSAPGRVVFVVRGPAPSCGVAGRFSVRGRRGTNRVGFTGRLRRRTLGPGAYRITAKTRAGTAARPVIVVIEPTKAERSFACGVSSGRGSDLFAPLLAGFTSAEGDSPGPAATTTTEGPINGAKVDQTQEPDTGLLPAVKGRLRSIPEILPGIQTPDSSSPSRIVGVGMLFLLALSGLGLLLYVLRFLRRSYIT